MPQATQDRSYLPANSEQFFCLQMLRGDRRAVSRYEGEQHIPYCITRRISREDIADIDQSRGPVTFTARVPLRVVVLGESVIINHLQETAFDFPVELDSCEFRPVGATIEEFDSTFCGDVLLQVTCAVAATS